MTCTPSTPYSRDLGDELRRLRESLTRYTGVWLADVLGWDQSKVSNIENGKARASEADLVQYLTACSKNREFINEFLERYRNAFDLCLVQAPYDLRTRTLAESAADRITSYHPAAIPDLLQTEGYAEELLRRLGLTPEDKIQSDVRSQLERQLILRAHDRPECLFYVPERVVRAQLHDQKVMKEQIDRLLHKTHIIRIVPEVRAIPLTAGYVLWEYDKAAPVVFVESDVAKVFAQDERTVARCRSIFGVLDTVAFDVEQSRDLLRHLIDDNGQ